MPKCCKKAGALSFCVIDKLMQLFVGSSIISVVVVLATISMTLFAAAVRAVALIKLDL